MASATDAASPPEQTAARSAGSSLICSALERLPGAQRASSNPFLGRTSLFSEPDEMAAIGRNRNRARQRSAVPPASSGFASRAGARGAIMCAMRVCECVWHTQRPPTHKRRTVQFPGYTVVCGFGRFRAISCVFGDVFQIVNA
eukprot:3751001-Prymnesium_polylepis.1